MNPSPKNLVTGLFWAAVAIVVWSGSLVMLRLGVTTTLNAFDLTVLRIAVAALLLFPVIRKQGFAWDRLGFAGLSTMVLGFGAPYILLVSLGLKFAPAAAAGALNPGLMAVFVVLASWWLLGDGMRPVKLTGIAAILLGAAVFANVSTVGSASIGHLIFSVTAAMWAGYTLVVRRARIPALHATAIVAVGSAILYLPVYVTMLPKNLAQAPWPDILLQAAFQGVFVSIVAVFAFNRSAEHLGPTAGATLPALIPLTTLGLGFAVLGEAATPQDIAAAAMIGVGVALTLAPAAVWRRRGGWRRPLHLKQETARQDTGV